MMRVRLKADGRLVEILADGSERALPPAEFRAADYFTNARPDVELSPRLRLDGRRPRCVHYPWWRIGELITNDVMFDIVTSNANLLEFNEPALDDYLALMHRCLKPDGIFLVQCTGFAANGTVEQLLDKIHGKGFAPLIFVLESVPIQFPGKRSSVAELGNGVSSTVTFTTNNALFVRAGHPLFEKYFDRRNYHHNFISSEPIVRDTFFSRPPAARRYATSVFVEETEKAICASNDASLKRPAVKTAAVA